MPFGPCSKHGCSKIVCIGVCGESCKGMHERVSLRERGGVMGNMLRRGESGRLSEVCLVFLPL
jgi:hypothetical protein